MKEISREIPERNVFVDNKFFGGSVLLGSFVLIVLAILFLAEGVLRVFSPQPLIPRYVTNASYGIRMNYPNIDIWHTTPDYKVNIRTNSKGVRSDKEIQYSKQPDKKRIVVLGDSFTMGYGVNKEDLYLSILEKKLIDGGYQAEVINLGVSGFSNAEELIALENEGLKYKPDLVVLAFYQNDLIENVISNLYGIKDGELVRINKEYLPQIKLRNSLYSFKAYKYLAEHSHLLYFFRQRLSRVLKKSMYKKNIKKDFNINENNSMKKKRELAAKIIDRIYQVAKNFGKSAFILLDIRYSNFSTNIPIKEMVHFDEMNFFDSSKVLDEAPEGTLLYWKKSHGHWTPYSHGIVGERLAQFIIEKKLLD